MSKPQFRSDLIQAIANNQVTTNKLCHSLVVHLALRDTITNASVSIYKAVRHFPLHPK